MTTVSLGWGLVMPGIPPGPLLLVSPHLDDAVFSCEALIGRDEPIDVLNVFSGAPDPPQVGWWDVECGFANSEESMAARRLEDQAAYEGTPHRVEYLDLLELQHVEGRTPDDFAAIGAAVAGWLDRNPGGIVALPAGAGCRQGRFSPLLRRFGLSRCSPPQHIDHLNVRNALLDVLRPAGASVLLYEEMPYVFGGPADREVAKVADGAAPDPIVVAIDRERKAARVARYASQIEQLSPPEGRLDEPHVLPPHERYWLLRPSTSE